LKNVSVIYFFDLVTLIKAQVSPNCPSSDVQDDVRLSIDLTSTLKANNNENYHKPYEKKTQGLQILISKADSWSLCPWVITDAFAVIF
jgi:hypothetical protein